MLYCQPAPDYLPDPASCLITGITPQVCLERGIPEHEFAAQIEEALAQPGTIGVGYNTIRFDDEFTRFMLWRNLRDPEAQDMDVDAIHQGFLRGFRQGGGMLRTGSGVARAERTGALWRLTLEDGSTLSAATVVNAAGAWADTVAQVFGVAPVGIVPMRRSAFTFDAGAGHDSTAWPALVAIDESWYIKPGHGQLLGSPANADPTTPHDVVPEEIDIATGIWRIEEATTLTIRRPTSAWAGLRSFVPDGELVIGFDDAVPGFFWLAGQGGYGIQSAAGSSALADALLRDAAGRRWWVRRAARPGDG